MLIKKLVQIPLKFSKAAFKGAKVPAMNTTFKIVKMTLSQSSTLALGSIKYVNQV